MSEYEYAGTWSCEHCGSEYEVESKTDVLKFALSHRCEDND